MSEQGFDAMVSSVSKSCGAPVQLMPIAIMAKKKAPRHEAPKKARAGIRFQMFFSRQKSNSKFNRLIMTPVHNKRTTTERLLA